MKTIFSLLFLSSILSFSQIVNIENKRLSTKKDGFSGSIALNMNFQMNSKQLFQIGDKLKIAYTKKRNYLMLLTDHAFVKSSAESFTNKGYYHLRYNYTLKDTGRVVYEVFHQGQFNKIQKINLRLLAGTGFRFKIIDQKNYQLSFGTSVMGEYEELIDNGTSQDILISNYFSFDGQFTESVGLNSITYFQPKMIDFGNYRLANETQIRFKINKYLSYKIIYALNDDSRNLGGVRKTNYTLKNTLSFSF